MKITLHNPRDVDIAKYVGMVREWYPSESVRDFGENFHNTEKNVTVFLVKDKSNNVLGGGIVTTKEFFDDLDIEGLKVINELREVGGIYLDYFYVSPSVRGLGRGTEVLQILVNLFPKIYLLSEDARLPFYLRNGFKVVLKASEDSKYYILATDSILKEVL